MSIENHIVTKEEAMARMKDIADRGDWDYEAGHYEADIILSEFLNGLGHGDLIDLYDKIGKWYA